MADSSRSIEEEIDQLYQVPLSEFVAARDALAKRLRSEGDKEAAAQVKSLQKPSVSAWAVNQAFWSFPEDFQQMREAALIVEKAQNQGAESVREASQRRRKAVTTLLKRAQMILLKAGSGANPGILRRVETTLESLAAYGQSQPSPGAGRLVGDVDPPGFGALSVFGLAPSPKPAKRPAAEKSAPASRLPEPEVDIGRKTRLKELKNRLEKTLREVQILRAEVARVGGSRSRAEAETRIRRQAAREAEERWKKAAAKADEAEQELRRIQERERRTAGEHAKAQAVVEGLRRELDSLLET